MVNRCFKNGLSKKKLLTLRSLGVGLAFFILLFAVSSILDITICPVKRFLHVSCLGCGMTRGFVSILKLDFASACKYNILSVPIFICVLIYALLAVIDVAFDKSYVIKVERIMVNKYMFILYGAFIIVSVLINECYGITLN